VCYYLVSVTKITLVNLEIVGFYTLRMILGIKYTCNPISHVTQS